MDEQLFEVAITVLPEDFDQLGHVNNVVYLRYVQEVAQAHWQSIATPNMMEESIWVVGRHEIDYYHPIMPGDTVQGYTYVHKPQGLRFNRTVYLRAPTGKEYAKARTTWLLLNALTGKPRRIGDDILNAFSAWMVED